MSYSATKALFKVKEMHYNTEEQLEPPYNKLIVDYLLTSQPTKDKDTPILRYIEEYIFSPYNSRKLKIHKLPNSIHNYTPPSPIYL